MSAFIRWRGIPFEVKEGVIQAPPFYVDLVGSSFRARWQAVGQAQGGTLERTMEGALVSLVNALGIRRTYFSDGLPSVAGALITEALWSAGERTFAFGTPCIPEEESGDCQTVYRKMRSELEQFGHALPDSPTPMLMVTQLAERNLWAFLSWANMHSAALMLRHHGVGAAEWYHTRFQLQTRLAIAALDTQIK